VGGLAIMWHKEINKELCDLTSKTLLVPSAVCIELMIQTKHTVEEPSAPDHKSLVHRLSRSSNEERGDLFIRGFWSLGMDVIVDVRRVIFLTRS
jgi:hypothetical protein